MLAEAGKRVLLVDCDLRRGHLHDYFNIERVPGLADAVNNTCPFAQVLRITSHPNLTLLTTGAHPANPSELLMKENCNEMMKVLSAQYDIVIIDTAPILAVSDAAIVSRFAGTNFLVLGADSHHSMEIEMGIKRLSHANIKVHGYIYNNLKKEQQIFKMLRYNYYYNYKTETQ